MDSDKNLSRAAAYMAKNPVQSKKQRSELYKYADDIKELREAGATYAYIQAFLSDYELKISIVNLRKFVINHLSAPKKSPPHEKKTMESSKAPVRVEALKEEPDEKKKEKSQFDGYKPPKWAGDVDVRKLFFND